MKKKNPNARLVLKKASITALSNTSAAAVKGGATTFTRGCAGTGTLHTCVSFDRGC